MNCPVPIWDVITNTSTPALQHIYTALPVPKSMPNLSALAKYPFLKEASGYLKQQDIDLGSLLDDVAYARARALGIQRVEQALEEGEIHYRPGTTPADALLELLSYPVARILVSAVGDPYLIRRYALAEAVRGNKLLKEEDDDYVVEVGRELGIDAERANGEMKIHFADYLTHTSQLKSKEAKLVNQALKGGRVHLSKDRFVRIIQQGLQMKFMKELPLPVNKQIIEAFGPEVKRLKTAVDTKKSEFKARDMGKVSITRLPPCMKLLLAKAQAGVNLPHSGRFGLTSFLHTIGMDEEEIMRVLAMSPDFNEKIARYQIEHITGKISGIEYTPPECATLKTYGLCPGEDSLCKKDWMTHPLKYYRIKGKPRKKYNRPKKEVKDEEG